MNFLHNFLSPTFRKSTNIPACVVVSNKVLKIPLIIFTFAKISIISPFLTLPMYFWNINPDLPSILLQCIVFVFSLK